MPSFDSCLLKEGALDFYFEVERLLSRFKAAKESGFGNT